MSGVVRVLVVVALGALLGGCGSKDASRCKKMRTLMASQYKAEKMRAEFMKMFSQEKCMDSFKLGKGGKDYACNTKCIDTSEDYKALKTCMEECKPHKPAASSGGGTGYTRKYKIITACINVCRKKFGGDAEKQRACNIVCRERLKKKLGM